MTLNKKKIAAVLTLVVAVLAAVAKFLEDPAINEVTPVDLPVVVDAGTPDAGL